MRKGETMKNIRVKVRRGCMGTWWDFGIFEGRKHIMSIDGSWRTEKAAIRNAKAMAKHIEIPYDPEIINKPGC